jgi:hypothetical protein
MKRSNFGLSELLQSGILITLLGIAYRIGKVEQHFDNRITNVETRVAQLESVK